MMRDYLKRCKIFYSCMTVYRYMLELGLRSIVRKKKPGYVKGAANKVFPNLLNRNFKTEAPNQVWCTDYS